VGTRTNTRITDPEILERRYPVRLHRFGLRSGSGGAGRFRGGDGVVRELEFRRPLTVSILSERRVHAPYGLAGGEDGARGLNLLRRADGRLVNLGGKNTVDVHAGDRLLLHTPGGGGYGPRDAGTGASDQRAVPHEASASVAAAADPRGSVAEYTQRQEASV
jgi:5-oxoprolinase (ATP-hydrolysing)